MDIAIDPNILRRRLLQTRGWWLAVAVALVAVLLLLRQLISPSLARSEVRMAVVERGEISTEIVASGTVVPMNERVLISPVNSSIVEVYQPLGSSVKKGDAILKVESSQVELEIKKLRDQLNLKDLEIKVTLQTLQRELRELRNKEEIAGIDLHNQKVLLERYTTLYKTNIVSKFEYETATLNTQKAEIQLRQLTQQVADTLESNSNQGEQSKISRQLLHQQLADQEQLLSDTTVRASADGIITVLMDQLGKNVRAGDELVHISDLSSFRVDATLSDYYLHQISVGMPVLIKLGTSNAPGRLSRILPSVDNGAIRLQIELDNPGNAQLKSNLRVDAGILTQQRSAGMRVSNGIVFNGSGIQEIFVVQDGKAIKRKVEVGLQNSSYVEIVSGLAEGETIIISDMNDYQRLEQITLTN